MHYVKFYLPPAACSDVYKIQVCLSFVVLAGGPEEHTRLKTDLVKNSSVS